MYQLPSIDLCSTQATKTFHTSFALVHKAKSQFSECFTEQDFAYTGNDVNDGQSNTQPDPESCRASCRSIGAGYFTWHPDERCYCKSSDAGREKSDGDVSGETCLGETSYHKRTVLNQGRNLEG